MSTITQILAAIEKGEAQSSEQLLPIIYDELRKLARQRIAAENPSQTLQATDLVHEAYLRLVDNNLRQCWDSRGHFFAAAAEAMRRILVEQYRRKQALKRGGGMQHLELDESLISLPQPDSDIQAMHEALSQFEEIAPEKANIVKLRYFVGMTIPQVAEALSLSESTVKRNWTYARAWLHAELNKNGRCENDP